jgi:hypothetical protein
VFVSRELPSFIIIMGVLTSGLARAQNLDEDKSGIRPDTALECDPRYVRAKAQRRRLRLAQRFGIGAWHCPECPKNLEIAPDLRRTIGAIM